VATLQQESLVGCGVRKQSLAGRTGRLLRGKRRSRRALFETRGEDGQAFVEFIIILPIFFVLVYLVVVYAAALSNYDQVTDVARVGARAASIARFAGQSNPCAAATSAINNAKGGMTLVGSPSCTCTPNCNPASSIKVTVMVVAQNVLSSSALWNGILNGVLPGNTCGSQRCWTSSATAVLQ